MEDDLNLTYQNIKKQNFINYREDQDTQIKYMDPMKIFKLPLSFAGSYQFHTDLLKLNNSISDSNNTDLNYKIIYKTLNGMETEVKFVLQEDQSILLYKFKDKLITVPKLHISETLNERIIMSKFNNIYLIDLLDYQILLHKKINLNKKGFMQPIKIDDKFNLSNLNKIITFDIESITNMDSLKKEGDEVYFDPIVVSAFDFYNKQIFTKILRKDLNHSEQIPVTSNTAFDKNMRFEKLQNLSEFFLQFLDKKYHKFVLYAHNMAKFYIIFVLESLIQLVDSHNVKIEPLIRDNKLIKIRVFYTINSSKYHIDLHDSYQILSSSLNVLSKTFLKEKPELQKIENKNILSLLLSENERIKYNNNIKLWGEFEKYCIRDVISLAYIIFNFNSEIFKKFKVNTHRYPTISGLGLAIYLTNYISNNSLIPLISGEIYRDISKAYHGGHTDVYNLYSNKEVHSYDYSSMYPAQMLKHKMQVKNIDKIEGNLIKTKFNFYY